jgi:hypothetical protein
MIPSSFSLIKLLHSPSVSTFVEINSFWSHIPGKPERIIDADRESPEISRMSLSTPSRVPSPTYPASRIPIPPTEIGKDATSATIGVITATIQPVSYPEIDQATRAGIDNETHWNRIVKKNTPASNFGEA